MAAPQFNNVFSSQSARRPSLEPSMAESLPFMTMRGFDILDWHPAYQSCQRYFLDYAQYEAATQALCALLNIQLPFQWRPHPIYSSTRSSPHSSSHTTPGGSQDWMRSPSVHSSREWAPSSSSSSNNNNNNSPGGAAFVSLVPFVRRLIVTGFDSDAILHGFFGDAWAGGITPLRECERRNYLFAAKSGGWRSCKSQYDLADGQSVPFLQPLKDVRAEELDAAEKSWSTWLALEDWMVGPRAPGGEHGGDHGAGKYNVHMSDAESSRRAR